ncbi:Secreted beta-glucosidase sun1 [Purpureocillium lavendulum]|uniref:Secreted beta-glucosidase sun1 n=1 Tax=Purpureocillium lavendulum TaxID=1247861 RepID=A0AB34G4A4_9HYPO|nr:Secreted beta-glucosidase sun1 [Purpureocillium lavendulum]
MKNVLNYALAATMAASATASSHHHLHRHAKKHGGSRVEKRAPDAVTVYVAGATATAYEMGGKPYDAASAQACIKEGNCVVVGETTPTFSPPPPPPKPTTTSKAAAQFIEKPSTTSSPPPPPPKTTTSQAPPPPASTQAKPAKSNSFNSGATGVDAEFPSGKIKCSEFPSDYGALALDWLDLGKWSGLQFVPDFSPGALSISNIVTGVTGQTCSKGCMCSYACPPGYQKTQWSSAQGSTKQSIGGLYCNSNGYLELTRKSATTLCEKGAGGVTIQNDLSEVVSTCRTDYPGTESMVIPLVAQPGGSVDVTNPVQSKYYQWDGQKTTAQYYINPKGLGPKDACVWNSPACPKCAGNWAGVNLGVGQDDSGTTWIGLFANAPTSTAKLDFNIEITGDVSIKCGYSNGQFTGGSNGCTVSSPVQREWMREELRSDHHLRLLSRAVARP